ncbi:MAG: trans-sulfuration enzyme family protein [Bacteroidota bacterium]
MNRRRLALARTETQFVHEPQIVESPLHPISFPIYQTSTFAFHDTQEAAEMFAEQRSGHYYSRISNPTVEVFEEKMAILEHGEAAVAFGSGMAAVAAAVFAVAQRGDRVIASRTLYGGTYTLFTDVLPRFGISVDFVDGHDAEAFDRAIVRQDAQHSGGSTKLVYIETPGNPTLCIVDIAGVSAVAHKRGIPVAVDNTFATPYLQHPLKLGADMVLHSTTKYINGHGDGIGGVLIGSKDHVKQARKVMLKGIGAPLSPFNAWLNLRGLKTLPARMERHSDNALRIAEFLKTHRKVEKVYYPGLPDHPYHALAKEQMARFGGMVGFDVKGGRAAGEKLMNSLEVITLAVSLGDPDTLIEHPASMTHASFSTEELAKAGIGEGFVRLSVGLEHPDDLIDDLKKALDRI